MFCLKCLFVVKGISDYNYGKIMFTSLDNSKLYHFKEFISTTITSNNSDELCFQSLVGLHW